MAAYGSSKSDVTIRIEELGTLNHSHQFLESHIRGSIILD